MLRPFRAADFDVAKEMGADLETARWVPPLPGIDGTGVAAYFEECRVAGEMLHLVIADRQDDSYLGEVMLVIGEFRVGELGCGVIPTARGRGLAAQAFDLLATWSFEALGLGRLQLFVAQENVPALRLAERTRFRVEGVLREYWESEGSRLDTVVLSRLPGDPL